jgi:serine/threonine protein kinase
MAEIYKAKTFGVDGFEKTLAIKKILGHCSADKEFITMLTDEAKLVVNLSHTNIVQVYDLGRVAADYFISMEFIDGVNLREFMIRGHELKEVPGIEAYLYIMSEVCKGLDYAHSKNDSQGQPLGIVHRDISPQNILVSFEGEVKIVDFGIAKAAMNMSQTNVGTLKGKVTYMSPEQALGRPIDHRTDIYSCGIILYELMTGKRLFKGENQLEVLEKIRTTQITEATLPESIPEDVRPILARALAFSSKNRYASAADMQIDLTRLLYSRFRDFSPRKLSEIMQRWFVSEMDKRRQREREQRSSEAAVQVEKPASQVNLVHREDSRSGNSKQAVRQDTFVTDSVFLRVLRPLPLDHL